MFRASYPHIWDLLMGAVAILFALETTRRVLGWIVPVIAVCSYSSSTSGRLAHPGMSTERILEFTYSTQEALSGVVAATFATLVFPFMILGTVLGRSGAGSFSHAAWPRRGRLLAR